MFIISNCPTANKQGCKLSGNLTFPEIFRKFPEILAKAWEVMTSLFSFEFADLSGSRAKNKLFFLNITHEVEVDCDS